MFTPSYELRQFQPGVLVFGAQASYLLLVSPLIRLQDVDVSLNVVKSETAARFLLSRRPLSVDTGAT